MEDEDDSENSDDYLHNDPMIEDGDEVDDKDGEDIQVDFEFFGMKYDDYHFIKTFLKNYLNNVQWNSSELANLICTQTEVGSVIKVTDNEDDTFGFLTVINFHMHTKLQCIQQIKQYILSKKDTFAEILNDETQSLGLIISERMINVPPQLAPHLYRTLFEEIQKQPLFSFQNYLLLTSYYQEVIDTTSEKSKKKQKGNVSNEHLYFKPEDEILAKHASFSVEYPIIKFNGTTRWTFAKTVMETGHIMYLHNPNVTQIVQEMEAFINPKPVN